MDADDSIQAGGEGSCHAAASGIVAMDQEAIPQDELMTAAAQNIGRALNRERTKVTEDRARQRRSKSAGRRSGNRLPKRKVYIDAGEQVNDFAHSKYLYAAHPALFPNGRGLMESAADRAEYPRSFSVTQKQYNLHIFKLHNRMWAQRESLLYLTCCSRYLLATTTYNLPSTRHTPRLTTLPDYSFPFDLLDGINRHQACKAASFKAYNTKKKTFNIKHFEFATEQLAKGKTVREIVKAYPAIGSVIGDVKAVARTIRGSFAERHAFKATLRGLQTELGAPHVRTIMVGRYLTIERNHTLILQCKYLFILRHLKPPSLTSLRFGGPTTSRR